jgi:hypothetical protein
MEMGGAAGRGRADLVVGVVLPPEMTRLPDELARIDAYLDDERFVAPWRGLFDARLGRPSEPVGALLRLLYLEHYQLGYETLCREVADSITWRRFCRIPLEGRVPHPTTLVKVGRFVRNHLGLAAFSGMVRLDGGQPPNDSALHHQDGNCVGGQPIRSHAAELSK